MSWTINFGDHQFHESDLTLGMATQVAELTGAPWPADIPIISAVQYTSILAVFIAATDGCTIDDAVARVASLNMVDALGWCVPDDGEPAADADAH